MNTVRLNITLPADIARRVKATKNSSALIAESLREKFEREATALLEAELVEGYQARAKDDARLAAEFDATLDNA